jgi:uncharacterized protein YciI
LEVRITEVSQYLYPIKPTRDRMLTEGRTPEQSEILSRHFEHLQELAHQDVVLPAGRTQEDDKAPLGIVLLRADSHDATRAVMDGDPAVAGSAMHARLHPYPGRCLDVSAG